MLLVSGESKFSQEGLIRRGIKAFLMTAAKLSSTQADYKGMQSTCRAGTGAHKYVHACCEEISDSHQNVTWSRRHKKEHCSPFIRHPEVVSGRR